MVLVMRCSVWFGELCQGFCEVMRRTVWYWSVEVMRGYVSFDGENVL